MSKISANQNQRRQFPSTLPGFLAVSYACWCEFHKDLIWR